MSLRYISRVFVQAGMRGVQVMKDQAARCGDSTSASFKTMKDSAASSKPARRLSGSIESAGFQTAKIEKLRQAEESLRTVMYLSCWGPN